jgi:hypothetical protein
MGRARGVALTILAILFGLVAIIDIQKPFGATRWAGLKIGLVFFGKRLAGTPEMMLGPLFGIVLLIYAAGIWRMRRYALGLGYAYAIYVTINVALFSIRNPAPDSTGEKIFGVAYIIVALALTWGSAIILGRRRAELR